MVYQGSNPSRNALTEENYKPLADALLEAGFYVESMLYHDSKVRELEADLMRFSAVLVWVNPIMEPGLDRRSLDRLLVDISRKGVYVSTHPEVIYKLGTKEVLYSTRQMDWGGDTKIYTTYEDFVKHFLPSMDELSIRILKQYRGDGGKGVYKVSAGDSCKNTLNVVPADAPQERTTLPKDDFNREFKKYFESGGMIVNQKWAHGITNGMVRCYLTGTKVSGFGYQETVALCPQASSPDSESRPISRRYYFSEDCGLFQDLRQIMNEKWIPQLQEIHSIADEAMPLLWDIDLFINDVNTKQTEEKYTLCEMNVSCVSPFPPSSVRHVVATLKERMQVQK